jgi:hypothetical protein
MGQDLEIAARTTPALMDAVRLLAELVCCWSPRTFADRASPAAEMDRKSQQGPCTSRCLLHCHPRVSALEKLPSRRGDLPVGPRLFEDSLTAFAELAAYALSMPDTRTASA